MMEKEHPFTTQNDIGLKADRQLLDPKFEYRGQIEKKHYVGWLATGVAALGGLYFISQSNYLLFHCLVELFSIAVAWAVFMLVWNTRKYVTDGALLILGIAYLYVGSLDLLHTLSYKGMGIFSPHWGANLPTQLWISSRYLECLALFSYPFFLGRRVHAVKTLILFSLLFLVLLLSIFTWHIFPDCYIDGEGLTPFKVASEYIISTLLLLTLVSLYKKRDKIDSRLFFLISASLLITIASELAFTLYVDVYGVSNLIGHFLKLLSFFLIYMALIRSGLISPYTVIFRNLALELEEERKALLKSENLFRKVFEMLPLGLWIADKNGKHIQSNPAGKDIWGAEETFFDKNFGVLKAKYLPSRKEVTTEDWAFGRTIQDGVSIADELLEIEAADGRKKIIQNYTAPVLDDKGKIFAAIILNHDITARYTAEETLRQSEAQLNTIFQYAAAGMFLALPNGKFQKVNRSFCEILGYSEDELLALHYQDITHPTEHEADAAALRSLLSREADSFTREKHYINKNGQLVWGKIYVSLMRDASGDAALLVGVFHDITERKKLESAKKKAESRYKELFDKAPIGICSVSLDGRYLSLNTAHAQMYGYASPQEMMREVTNSKSIFVEPHDRDILLDMMHRMDVITDFECEVRRKDGHKFWTSRTIRAVRDNEGKIKYYESFIEDIQDRKEAEFASERARKQLLGILEQLEAGVYVFDPENYKIIYANSYITNAIGKELRGETTYQVLLTDKNECAFLAPDTQRLSKVGDTFTRELLFSNNRWYLCTAKLTPWLNDNSAVLVVAMDISAIKQAEQLKEDIERITRHDLKTPLNGIINLPQILISSGKYSGEDIKMLNIICNSGKRMLHLIDSSLSMFKLEIGKYLIQYKEVEIIQEICKIELELKPVINTKKVTIDCFLNGRALEENDMVYVQGDVTLIPLLFSNLITNAVEASPPDETVSIAMTDTAGSFTMAIHNLGSVPEAIRENFFGKYVTQGKEKGTGLGTYSALLIARAHDGLITMETSESQGTTVTIVLPRHEISDEPATEF